MSWIAPTEKDTGNAALQKAESILQFSHEPDDQIASDNWNRPYTREAAAFPAKRLRDYQFWPHVGRVDNVYGDRNPACSCVGMEAYES